MPALPGRGQITIAIAMFFAFPEDARWNAERQAVEFGGEIGEYRRLVRSGGASSKAAPAAAHRPRGPLELVPLSGPASRASPRGTCALHRRQLTEDGGS